MEEPFSIFQYCFLILVIILAAIGGAGAFAVIAAGIWKRDALVTNLLFVYNLAVSDGCLSLWMFCSNIVLLKQGDWGAGKIMVYCDASVIMVTMLGSLTLTFFITLERYLLIVRGMQLSLRIARIMVVTLWIMIAIALALNYLIFDYERNISPSVSGWYAMLDWTSRDPVALTFISISLGAVFLPLIFIIYAYYQIWTKFRMAWKTKKMARNHREENPILDPVEIVLLLKAAVIVGVFFTCWMPEFVVIIIQVISGKKIDIVTDSITALLAILNSILNPFIFILLDARVRSSVEECFHVKIWNVTERVKLFVESKNAKEEEGTTVNNTSAWIKGLDSSRD